MHTIDYIINYSAMISGLVFTSLSYDTDLNSASLINTAVQKLPPNIKEPRLFFTVQKHWVKVLLSPIYELLTTARFQQDIWFHFSVSVFLFPFRHVSSYSLFSCCML